MKPVAILYDDIFLKHDLGPGHPECPARLQAITESLNDLRQDERYIWVDPPEASPDDIARVHSPQYVDWIRQNCEAGGSVYPALEGNLVPETYPAALKAAGAVIQACDKVWDGEWGGAFALVRPPGHHAVKSSAMGFCVFNNIAVAAQWLVDKKKAASVLIVDFDVHHGNGTQDAFYSDGKVAYFSTHQWPHYPGTGSKREDGEGNGIGANLNVPLRAGDGDDEILSAFNDRLKPWTEERKPEFLLISAGFDAHEDDPLSEIRVTTDGYRQMANVLKEIADDHCMGRWVITLEGGYNMKALGDSSRAFLEGIVG
ncbi:histone deacetylase [candidate division LCP-89 bacterium B3_LCP]|uniref:Histone deacetylase n=1 Tax=candidate division LCP-89 bacterium B3_LCP TaxID=2012998 RepID=A0A532URH4_UNCL8|nr:MAG: histone deacetylase [candidate division LCP-89 bacterium B3_LCP]